MTIATEQIKPSVDPKVKVALTLTCAASYTYYENDRVLDVEFFESSDSQTATILLNNSSIVSR